MCGIAGIVSPHPSLVQQQRLQQMIATLQHRGPEGEGSWINQQQTVALGHRRLCIVDLSTNAAQPLHYLHYTIIFNGEIYNYRELKQQLANAGYRFSTLSDTEVIPAAYDHWGKDCLQHFDGMFAFALWDNKEQSLWLARDRFGEKPLYYTATYATRGSFETLFFASEMKALFAAGVTPVLNGSMMLNYLTLGYVQNPVKKTETFYSNILSLPPGNYLAIQPATGKIQMTKWYRPQLDTISITDEDAIEQFQALFTTSIRRRLRSDVAVGTSLSGGLDSASVLAAISKEITSAESVSQWKNKAFTASFPGFEKDETALSKIIAEKFEVQQYLVKPDADDWLQQWQRLMYYQEEPLQSSSVLTQYMVYKTAKQNGVTVLLDGQGADEILGGYKKYTHWYLQQLLSKKQNFNKEKKLLQQNDFLEQWSFRNYAAAWYPEKAAQKLQAKARLMQKGESFINEDFYLRYASESTLYKPVVKQLEDILFYNTFHFGLEELLRYADRNSMAHSVEVRLPFLLHELVEFVFSLPSHFKIRDGFTKWILRKSMDKTLPAAINWRTGKVGFEPPQKEWMQHKHAMQLVLAAKEKLVSEKVLDKKVLDQKLQPKAAHEANNNDWRYVCAAYMFNKPS